MKKSIAFILITIFLFGLTACGGEQGKTQVDYSAKIEDYDYVKNHIEENISSDLLEKISDITVVSTDEKNMTVNVRVVLAGGAYIPQAAQEICPLAKEAMSERGYGLERVSVQEYSESNKDGMDTSTLINWHTKDGEIGFLADARKEQSMIGNKTIDELFDYFNIKKVEIIEDGHVYNVEITLNLSSGERLGKYTGNIKNGLPHGEGQFESKNTAGEMWTYNGNWKDGHKEGLGETVWQEYDEKHIGNYSNDLPNGNGSYYVKGELTFEGEFKDGGKIEPQ